jgi:hypothetical protein
MGATRDVALPAALPARARTGVRALTPWLSVALAVPFVVAVAVKLALDSDHVSHPGLTAAYRAYLIAVPMLIGLAWWRRRPRSPYGPLLAVLGLAAVPLALQSSDVAPVVAVGVIAEPVYLVLTVYLLVAFPSGRLHAAADRWLVGAFGLGTLLFYVPALLLLPDLPAGGVAPIGSCAPGCPPNPLRIGTAPGFVDAAADVAAVLTFAATGALGGRFLARLRLATRPQRREVAAIAATAFPFFPALALLCLARLAGGGGNDSALGWVYAVAGVVFTLGFLVALVQAELFAGAALRRMLTELAGRRRPRAGVTRWLRRWTTRRFASATGTPPAARSASPTARRSSAPRTATAGRTRSSRTPASRSPR